MRDRRLTKIQQGYLDIVVDEYGGFVPHGEKRKIADRLGCSLSTLSKLDSGESEAFTRAFKERMKGVLPFADPVRRMAVLHRMLDDSVEKRKKRGQAMSSKDPVDIVDAIRKETAPATQVHVDATQNIYQQNIFDAGSMDDAEISRAINVVMSLLRNGDISGLIAAAESGNIIEGDYSELARSTERIAGGAESPQAQESTALPDE